METADIKKIIEVLLFVTDQPLPEAAIRYVLGELATGRDIEQLVKELAEEYAQGNRPMELRFIAGGWQFSTRKEFSPWVRKLYRDKTTLRLSNSALETLSVVAYKQPITRSEIEEIRGVEVSGVLETLLERKLVKIVGRKETIGRPLLYGTTQEFLRHFGLSHLSELPALEELVPGEDESGEVAQEVAAAEETPEETSVIETSGETAENTGTTVPESEQAE